MTNDVVLADRARHLTTTARIPHPWEYEHDEVGYNFRLPNLNAALGCAQMERLTDILTAKREIALAYKAFFAENDWARFQAEPEGTTSNYWLCAIDVKDRKTRDALLEQTNQAEVMTRPAWKLLSDLPMYAGCQAGPLANARWLQERVVNLPSSAMGYGKK